MASPVQSSAAWVALTDELLEEIFLRLPMAADLARASTACATFRRVIADHSFLRRYRAFHPPPLLGIATIPFTPAEPPHPSAPAARAFADAGAGAADFSYSFLPSPARWRDRDFRDGRALLSAVPDGRKFRYSFDYDPSDFVYELAVCDPVHRRYLLLPRIPDDLAGLVHQPDIVEFEPLLAPAGEDERGTSFRVICLVQCKTKLVVFEFSSGRRTWRAVAFDGWKDLSTKGSKPDSSFKPCASEKHYAHGCFCWVQSKLNKLLVFDTRPMELSCFDLPPIPQSHRRAFFEPSSYQRAIVEAGEGRLEMFTCVHHGPYYLCYTILQSDVRGANQWQLESTIPLPLNYRYNIMGVAGGYLLLHGIPEDEERPNYDCFSMNLKTLQLEWFCKTECAIIVLCQLYAGFPPPLSPPTI
ncbi:hypothetical protein ACP70R_004521 [Stipagrostis hirtigluma subsp. patula]